MKFRVRIRQDQSGDFYASTLGEPDCYATGKTRNEALENIREEIRYRQEYCPCSWLTDDFVQLEVEDE